MTENKTHPGLLYTLKELNNPLTNILLCLSLLESGKDDPQKEKCYGIIRSSASQIETVLRDICHSIEQEQSEIK